MRDSKEALRHRVDYLEGELAEKETELARLRAESENAPNAKKKRQKKERAASGRSKPASEPPAPPELRFGKLQPNGSVRYVVRPIELLWVGIMAAISAALVAVVGSEMVGEGKGFPWAMLVIFGVLPLAPTFRAGFDVDVEQKTIRVWQAWGPVTYASFTLNRLRLPEVHSSVESHTNSDGTESRGRVTRLYWTNENIRSTLDGAKLSELMHEVRALAASAER